MKNSNDLKTFSPAIFGGGTVAGKGGDVGAGGSFNDGGMVWTPGINPGGSQYNESTGIYYSPPIIGSKGAYSKVVEVIDLNGNPLVGAHITWSENGKTVGVTTNGNGEATVSVPTESTQISITYVGKRTHLATFANLGGLITLQENVNNLPPVVVGQPTKPTTTTLPATSTNKNTEVKKTNWVKTAAIGVGALLLISALGGSGKKSKSSSNGLSGTKSKKRKGKKAKGKKRKGLREPAAEVTL